MSVDHQQPLISVSGGHHTWCLAFARPDLASLCNCMPARCDLDALVGEIRGYRGIGPVPAEEPTPAEQTAPFTQFAARKVAARAHGRTELWWSAARLVFVLVVLAAAAGLVAVDLALRGLPTWGRVALGAYAAAALVVITVWFRRWTR